MEEYKSNSQRSREEKRDAPQEKKVEKVISGTTKRRKKNGFVKLADTFLQNDVHSVWDYVIDEILIPAAKRTFTDAVHNSVDMLIHGETRSRDSGRGSSTRAAYYSYYDTKSDRRSSRVSTRPRSRSSYGFDDVVFDNRGDCEEVLDRMDEIIQASGVVSVAEYLEMAGYDPDPPDWKYGWDSLRGAVIRRVAEGYMISMPRAGLID